MTDQEITQYDHEIKRVTVLTGHVSPETAYVVDDYPSGGRRCKKRYWIETGKRKGTGQRLVTQTTNPKVAGDVWFKPHAGTYSPMLFMYLDEIGHVQTFGIPLHIDGERDVRTRYMGIYDAMTEDEKKMYNVILRFAQRMSPTCWAEWAEHVAEVAKFIATTGQWPELVNHVWSVPDDKAPNGKRIKFYMSDPTAYVVAARDLLVGNVIDVASESE